MFDLGEYEPPKTLGTENDVSDGTVQLARFATTDEQRQDSITWLLEQANDMHEQSLKARILWAHQDATILQIECDIEHVAGKPVRVLRTITEMTDNGAEIRHTEAQCYAQLESEVLDLHERKML